MEKKTNIALYSYFGQLGLFEDNIPGHTFYQLGLIDELSLTHDIGKFDFLNYADSDETYTVRPVFPNDLIGHVFETYSDSLIENYRIKFDQVIANVRSKKYAKLFLKARFRNLSTLEKKLRDAAKFEEIIKVALEAGYEPADIVILDTDLSLSTDFLKTIEAIGIKREIPSVTMKACSKRFLNSCLELFDAKEKSANHKRPNHLTYYGNLSFENYKEGHSKDPIIREIIDRIDSVELFNGDKFTMTVAAKSTSELENWIAEKTQSRLCPRQNREEIWDSLLHSLVSINVSKNLYLKEGFTPARVYESLLLGVIPVSYKDPSLHPAMSFETADEFFEICKFLAECSPADYNKILCQMVNSI
jgi:hypothetical protein